MQNSNIRMSSYKHTKHHCIMEMSYTIVYMHTILATEFLDMLCGIAIWKGYEDLSVATWLVRVQNDFTIVCIHRILMRCVKWHSNIPR